MHRQSGRPLKKEYYVEIELLPDGQLFSASEIARRKYDKHSDLKSYQNMFHAIYQFSVRNGINLAPDNCRRQPGGKPILEGGKARLKPGHRSARWYGRTWKSKLYVEDRIALKKYMVEKLLLVLGGIQTAKAKVARARPSREDHMEPKKRWSVGILVARRRWWLAVALLAAALFTAGAAYNHSLLGQGFQVLRSQGAKAALAYFQRGGESYDNLFGQAWASFRNGELQRAEELSLRVLESKQLMDQARASYLLGILKTDSGEYIQAKEFLLNAEAIFETTGNISSQYRTRLTLVKLYLAKKDFQNATYYLNLAGVNPEAERDEYYLYLHSQLAFLENDFESALELSLQREVFASDDLSVLQGVYSDIGLYYGLIGNSEKCLAYTVKAQGLAGEQENKVYLMHNNVNMCLYLKCSFQDYTQLRESILDYARRQKDVKLMEMMYFVDKFTCPIQRSDPGHPPPPDDPDDPPPNGRQPENQRTDPGHVPPPDDPDDPPPDH